MSDMVALAIDGESTMVTRRIYAPGAYDEGGEWVPGATTDSTIYAAIQPVTNGEQLEDLPEGIREEARAFLWSRVNVQNGDLILYQPDGDNEPLQKYRVIHRWNRQRDGGFTKAALGLVA